MILNKIGCQVQGSDMSEGANIKSLEEQGVKCFIGHEYGNVAEDVDLQVAFDAAPKEK